MILLSATLIEGQWWWAVIMLVGELLAGAYVFLVLGNRSAQNRRIDAACANSAAS